MACPIGLDCMLFLRSRTIRSQIFCQICNDISLYTDCCRSPWGAGSKLWIDSGGMVNKVRCKIGHADIVVIEITSQLMDYGTNNLEVCQFLGTCRGGAMEEHRQNRTISFVFRSVQFQSKIEFCNPE